jgi:hypothetical protein
MRQRAIFTASMLVLTLLLGTMCLAQHSKKGVDLTKTAVVLPFETEVKGAAGLPEAARASVIRQLKEEKMFAAVLTPEEAKDMDKATLVEITGHLVDFEAGSAAKRLLVGFGSGRSHAGFDFAVKDSATGDTVWKKRIKQTASFWFNSTTSSAAERAELPDGLAKKLIQELKKEK